MEGWKAKCMSRAGRITLAQSILNNMTIFHMQLQRLPSKIHKELDKAVRHYIWGSSAERRKIHLINWDVVCRLKERGGLGVRKSEAMNKALLAKLAWRVLTQKGMKIGARSS